GLAGAAVLNRVEHAAQDTGRVLDGLLVPDLGAARVQVGDVSTLVVGGNLEGAAGAGGGLLKDQGNVLAAELRLLGPRILGGLQVGRQCDQEHQLLGGEVEFLDKTAITQVERHRGRLSCPLPQLFWKGIQIIEYSFDLLEGHRIPLQRTRQAVRPASAAAELIARDSDDLNPVGLQIRI